MIHNLSKYTNANLIEYITKPNSASHMSENQQARLAWDLDVYISTCRFITGKRVQCTQKAQYGYYTDFTA